MNVVTDTGRPLFERFPGTASLPWTAIADLPTPVERVDPLARSFGAGSLWVKRDDMSGQTYGGNKVRKLEFLLGEALAAEASDLITFGAAGSNHALATAIYGAAQGLKVHSMLMPQPNARYVGRNLLASVGAGADPHLFADRDAALRGAVRLRAELRKATGREPFVVPFGGTTPSSTAGFVNAALELAGQVEEGLLPEPDFLYVTLGSMGTAAGLALGLRVAGLSTRVMAVPVVMDTAGTADALLALIRETQDLLHKADAAFPVFDWTLADVTLERGFLGEGYAAFTSEGMAAVREAGAAGLVAEGTYTGKTLAALGARGRTGGLAEADVLFWNTYNSRDLSSLVEAGDASLLPEGLREYVQGPVQERDRG